ncbi:MAG: PDZ domain-containing protein [Chlamydiia bacterium]|nr:PDZ domain-containing protein [Chlamydiia bacterium]
MGHLFEYHIDKKGMSDILVRRSLKIYIDMFDPVKTYLLEQECESYLHPNERLVRKVLDEYEEGEYTTYFNLDAQLKSAVFRAREWRKGWLNDPVALVLQARNLIPEKNEIERDFSFSEQILKQRHRRFFLGLIALQIDHLPHPLPPGKEAKLVALCEKKIRTIENFYLGLDENGRELTDEAQNHLVYQRIMKSLAKSLDAHTAYYSPEEAYAMKVQLEKGMCGIGVVLSEGVDGVVVAEVIKGGPAAKNGLLRTGDTIVEVDGESVREYSFARILEVLRGEEGSKTILGVMRYPDGNVSLQPDFIRVQLVRSMIILNDKRCDYEAVPFGDGVIGKVTLYSFYEGDDGIGSERDLREAISELQKQGPLYGLVLDMRDNTGGFLSQAVKVSGLFITSGVVVISKYSDGTVKYYRAVDGSLAYDGPLVVLVSKGSASATEIVAGTLQDYGVAVIVGDENTYGKGTIQHQTVTGVRSNSFFKVTIGRYYTVSGKSTQIEGVKADIIVPTLLKNEKMGEAYLDYPLPADNVEPAFDDHLMDVDQYAQKWFKKYYLSTIQKPTFYWRERLALLQSNSQKRLEKNKNYQVFLQVIEPNHVFSLEEDNFGQNDLQMEEAINIVSDMILLKGNINSY